MFREAADHYDLLYSFKDYDQEARRLRELLEARADRPLESLLDAACGTGRHLEALAEDFRIEGFDLDPGLLGKARERLPGVSLHEADLVDVDLGRRFDVVTCLFGSISYVGTPERLDAAVASLAAHLEPGGILVVEPWIRPEEFRPGRLHVHSGGDEERAVTRMATATLEGRCSVIEMQYLLGERGRIRHAVERHVTALFTDDEYRCAFERAGLLRVERHDEGLAGRGLWVGTAPEAA